MVVAEQKKEEKDTQNTQKKKKQRMKTEKKFLIRPLPFGLNSCMTQQNKGVSKIFNHIRKNRVPYLEIKWKPQKNLQFDRLVVVKVVVV